MTQIRPCNCKNEYQDNRYGKGRRVKNKTVSESWRCTVCATDEKQTVKRK